MGAVAIACGSSAHKTDGGQVLPDSHGAIDAPIGTPDANVVLEQIHYLGRFDATHRFAWPGSAIGARFDGTTISAQLDDGGQNWFTVSIDGGAPTLLHATAGSNSYVLASGLTAGPHDVLIRRRTESFFGITTFQGFSGATLVPSPRPSRFVEMIGDSITCGYGDLGVGPTCSFDATTESEPDAWGALAAAQLGAAHAAIAYSGKGIYRNNGGDMTDLMSALYLRTFADDPASTNDFASYTPDVVVIDLGTNDFAAGDPGQPFVDAYDAFVQSLRARWPNAFVVVASSPMISDAYPAGQMQRTIAHGYLTQVVALAAARGDTKVSYVEIAEQDPADGYGCGYHPSAITQQKMATALAAHIHSITGW